MDEAIPLKLDAELFEGGRSKGHHQILKKQEWRRARGLAESPARAVRPGSKAAGRSASATMSEADLVAALEHKYLACLIRGREFEPQSLADLADTRHLRGIARRHFAAADPARTPDTAANLAAPPRPQT